MSLSAMLAGFDEAALEGLASKGLVRRALKDWKAGNAEIEARSDSDATVIVTGDTVQMTEKGPTQALCTCSAVGICRHILTAVLVLQDAPAAAQEDSATGHADEDATDVDPDDTPDARSELLSLTDKTLATFARADLPAAVELAADPTIRIEEKGKSCVVTFDQGAATVTFIAGLSLKEAAYKGPRTKSRLLVAAAALAVRQKEGLTAPVIEAAQDEPVSQPFTVDMLNDMQGRLAKATSGTLSGSSALASDMFFDMAISARAEAAPRVSSQLRALSRQARLAPTRHVDFVPERFIVEAGRTYALLEALKSAPDDVALTGALRRDYQPTDPVKLVFVGAETWTAPSGARGLTGYAVNPEANTWLSVTDARGAGMDPTFTPQSSYQNTSLWGGRTMNRRMGQLLHLKDPRIDQHGSIALRLETSVEEGQSLRQLSDTLSPDILHQNWGAAFADLKGRLGSGLRRGAFPQPCLIAPKGFGSYRFDEMRQTYFWDVIDHQGQSEAISLDVEHSTMERLSALQGQTKSMLVLAHFVEDELHLKLVSMHFDDKGQLDIRNLTLDILPKPPALSSIIQKARTIAGQIEAAHSPASLGSLETFTSRVIEACLTALSGRVSNDHDGLVKQCEERGLTLIGGMLAATTQAGGGAVSALKTAYLVDELRREAQLL